MQLSDLHARNVAAVGAICLIPTLVKILWYPDYPGADDAFIHLSIIQHILSGQGWGVVPNHPINLSTSPLFTIMMMAAGLFSSNVLFTGLWVSMIATPIALLSTFYLALRISSSFKIALICCALAASNVQLWRWSGTFMEASIAYSVVVWISFFFFHKADGVAGSGPPSASLRQYGILGALIGFAVLLRPELGLLGVAFFLHDLLNKRRFLVPGYLAAGIGFVVILVPYAIWSKWYFGSMIPSTFTAKTTSSLIVGSNAVAWKIAQVILSGAFGVFIIFGFAIVYEIGRKNYHALMAQLRAGAFFWVFPLLGFLFYYLKTENLESAARYYLPFMATLPIGIASLAVMRSARLASLFLGLSGAQLLTALVVNHVFIAPTLATMWPDYVRTMSDAASAVNEHCNAGDSVLVERDIGVISTKLDSRCRLHDAGGLASPELQRLSLSEQIKKVHPNLVLESLGDDRMVVEAALRMSGRSAHLVWQRQFRSHGLSTQASNFTTRLYLVSDKIGAVP